MIPQNIIEELANALFNVEPKLVKELLGKIPDRTPIPYYSDMPIHYITRFVEMAINKVEDYNESFQPRVRQALRDNDEIKQMLSEKFGVNFIDPIPFHQMAQDGYFSPWNYDEDGYDEVFFTDDVQQLKSLGATDIDLELYSAVMKFDFDKVKQLLEQGANPAAKIMGEDYEYTHRPDTAISEIGQEIIGLPHIFNTAFLDDKKEAIKRLGENVYYLTSLAAHNQMYNLLESYCND